MLMHTFLHVTTGLPKECWHLKYPLTTNCNNEIKHYRNPFYVLEYHRHVCFHQVPKNHTSSISNLQLYKTFLSHTE